MFAFVVSYSVMSACLEEQRYTGFAHRHWREDLEKPDLTEGEIWRMAKKTTSQMWTGMHLWSQDPFRRGEKVTTQEASAKGVLESWVKKQVKRSELEDELSRWGQNAWNGLQRGKRTGEERSWRCFEQKVLGRVMTAVSWIDWDSMCFMVTGQSNTGLEKVLLSLYVLKVL